MYIPVFLNSLLKLHRELHTFMNKKYLKTWKALTRTVRSHYIITFTPSKPY